MNFSTARVLKKKEIQAFNAVAGDKYWKNHKTGFTLQISAQIKEKNGKLHALVKESKFWIPIDIDQDTFYIEVNYPQGKLDNTYYRVGGA
jgi:hypothetical protein